MRVVAVVLAMVATLWSGAARAQEPGVVPEQNSGQVARRTIRISGGVIAGNLLKKVAPSYPESAKEKHITGSVVMRAIIDKTGTIENLTVISGPEELRKAPIKAVSQWKYKPYILNGAPTEVDTTITVNFAMAGYGPPAMPPPEEQEPPPAPEAPAVLPNFQTMPALPGVLRVSGGVMAGMLETRVAPAYPETDAAGTVVLIATIAKDGTVATVDAFSGPQALRGAALDAVRQWRYRPYLLNGGEATEVQTTVLVRFAR